MTDYGHDLLFGTILTAEANRPDTVIELATASEQFGLDVVSVPDHPYRPGFLDAMTVLATIAAHTDRVRVFPNVANLPLRAPAGLARAVASLDVLSAGRAELGLGAGGYPDDIAEEGGARRTPSESVDALTEAIHVVRALWTPGPPATYRGEHYHIDNAAPGPVARHDIAIWVGAIKPRMLRLVGALADGWLPSATRVPPADLAERHRIIDDAAGGAGRRPHDVRRLYNLAPTVAPLTGEHREWAERLAELTLTEGVSGYLLPVRDSDDIRRFALDVVPDVRERVAAERRQELLRESSTTTGAKP